MSADNVDYKALWKQLRLKAAKLRADKRVLANKVETASSVALVLACEADGIEEIYWLMREMDDNARAAAKHQAARK